MCIGLLLFVLLGVKFLVWPKGCYRCRCPSPDQLYLLNETQDFVSCRTMSTSSSKNSSEICIVSGVRALPPPLDCRVVFPEAWPTTGSFLRGALGDKVFLLQRQPDTPGRLGGPVCFKILMTDENPCYPDAAGLALKASHSASLQ